MIKAVVEILILHTKNKFISRVKTLNC